MHSAKNNWDFWTLLPEALHQVTVVMSDRGIPASYRHMHGSVRFLMPCCVRKWNFTQKRSLFALMKLNVWLPNPCMWR